jgi:hypothetical protein
MDIQFHHEAPQDRKAKLSDEFGQYVNYLHCECGHTRRRMPRSLAAFAGWEANLADVVRRMRCSKCGKKSCKARAVEEIKPRGYHGH